MLRPLLWSLAFLAIVALLAQRVADTAAVRGAVRDRLIARLVDRLDTSVSIDDVRIGLLPFTLELHDLVIGARPARSAQATDAASDVAPIFLSVPRAVVEADVRALGDGDLRLERLVLDRPQMELVFFEAGGDNLLRPIRGDAARRFDIFIDQLTVRDGRFLTLHERARLSFSAHGVEGALNGRGELRIAGEVRADEVIVGLPGARPEDLVVRGEITVGRDGLTIDHARGVGTHVSATATGECTWRAVKRCVVRGEGRVDAAQLDALGYVGSHVGGSNGADTLVGEIDFDGVFEWRPGSLGWRSAVRSDRLRFFDRTFETVRGVVVADRFGLRVDDLESTYAGGTVRGTVTYDRRDVDEPIVADLEIVDLVADALLADQAISLDGIASRVEGRVRYRFPRTRPRQGDGESELTFRADDESSPPGSTTLALSGRASLSIEDGVVSSPSIVARAARQGLLVQGHYDLTSRIGRFTYDITTADLPALFDRLPIPAGSSDSRISVLRPTSGQGALRGTLAIDGGQVSTQIDLDLERVALPALDRPEATDARLRLGGSLRVGPGGFDALRVELGGPRRALLVRGEIPFANSSNAALETRPLRLTFDAVAWPLDSARTWIPFDLPLDGPLTGRVEVMSHGAGTTGHVDAALAPAAILVGSGRESRADALDLDRLAARLSWQGETIEVESVEARAAAGTLTGAGRLRRIADESGQTTTTVALDLRAPSLDVEAAPFDRLPTTGVVGALVAAELSLDGPLESPRITFSADAPFVRIGSPEAGRRVVAPSRIVGHLDLGRLTFEAEIAERLRLAGGGPLDGVLEWSIEGEDLGAWVPPVVPRAVGLADDAIDGAFSGRVRVDANMDTPADAAADIVLERLTVAVGPRALESASPVRAQITAQGIEVEALALVAPETDTGTDPAARLDVEGQIGWGEASELDLAIAGTIDSAWLPPLVPNSVGEGPAIEGRVRFEGRIEGPPTDPAIALRGTVEALRAALPADIPHELTVASGRWRLEDRRLWLEDIEGRVANGSLRVAGYLDLPRLAGGPAEETSEPPLALTLTARDLIVRYPEGWQVAGDADLTVTELPAGPLGAAGGAASRATVDAEDVPRRRIRGRLQLTEARYDEDLAIGFAEVLADALARQRINVERTADAFSRVALDVAVSLPGGLVIANNLADLEGAADLRVEGTLARPQVLGSVAFEPGGRLDWNDTDYRVDRARLVFADPLRPDPDIDLVAVTRIREYDVELALNGRLGRLDARFASNPPLPDIEVFRLLSTGESDGLGGVGSPRLDSATTADVVPASTCAAGLLYGQAASVVGNRVGALFGLDTFRVAPLTGSGDALSRTRITVGKRLSRDLFLTYSTDPSTTEDQRLQVEWQLGRNLVLVLTQNGDDSYSADARFEQSFD